jgi:hypothetical protein
MPFVTDFATEYFRTELEKEVPLTQAEYDIINGVDQNATRQLEFYNKYIDYIYALQSRVADPSFDDSVREKFGYNQSEFLIEYTFGDKYQTNEQLEPYIKRYYDPAFGNCFVFNSGIAKNGSKINFLKQSQPGLSNGLYMAAYVDIFSKPIYNFMNFVVRSYFETFYLLILLKLFCLFFLLKTAFGLKISINNQSYVNVFADKLFPLKTSTCTYIGIRKTISEALPKPYSKCLAVDNIDSPIFAEFNRINKSYQQTVCYEFCKQKKIIDTCGCASIEVPNLNDFALCNTVNQTKCSLEVLFDEAVLESCEAFCPLECVTANYEKSTAFEDL